MSGKRVVVKFRPEFKDRLLSGQKTMTSRTKTLGQPGDTFEAFGALFEIVRVFEAQLYEVATCYHQQEGFHSSEAFREIWRKIHPVVGWQNYQYVKVHEFRRIEAPHA